MAMARWDQYPLWAWGPESESAGRRRQWKSCHSGQLVVVRCVLWILARLGGICSFSLVAGTLRLCVRQATCEIGLKKWLRCVVPRAHLLPVWIENFWGRNTSDADVTMPAMGTSSCCLSCCLPVLSCDILLLLLILGRVEPRKTL